jgi:tungstate transport system substrate-binding protein
MKRTLPLIVLIALLLQVILAGCSTAPTAAPAAPAPTAVLATVAPAPTEAPTAVPPTATTEPTVAPTETTAPTAAPTATTAPTVAPTQAVAPTAAVTATAVATATAASKPVVRKPGELLLATTTSTQDSGLLDYLLPFFEKANNVKVNVVAVGTGQAIEIGRKGDADVLLVHARAQEDKFVADGQAKKRDDVMYNDFVIVGPKSDPAKIADAKDAIAAFKAISNTQSLFVSRGDKSGTNTKELSVWSSAHITPTKTLKWYNSIGQGMGDTLTFANEQQGYTLTDRGTWLAMQDKLKDLTILFGGQKLADNKDKSLLNPYGVMAVNPDKHPSVNYDLAMKFVDWILAVDTQKLIANYGVDKYGQPLFYANSAQYKAAQ